MNSKLWTIKRRVRYYWRHHKIQVILFVSTTAVIFFTAIIVILVFVFTGRGALVQCRDFSLTTAQQDSLLQLEKDLERQRSRVLGISSEGAGKCAKKWNKVWEAVKQDRSYEVSSTFVSLYECFHQNEINVRMIITLAKAMKQYSSALTALAESKEAMLKDNPALTPKEKLSLTSKRLKSTLFPYDLDLVIQTIKYRKTIRQLAAKYPQDPTLTDLLDLLTANPANPSRLPSLVDHFKARPEELKTSVLPILQAQDAASRALIWGYRRWKKAQRFKYSATHPGDSFEAFKRDHAAVYQELLRATNRVFLAQQAICRLSVYSTIHQALAAYSTNAATQTTLSELLDKPNFAKLKALYDATANTPKYNTHILPIIKEYERQSKSRLLALNARCDLKYQEARQQHPELTYDEFKTGDGAAFYKAVLAHRHNDYLKVQNEIFPK